MPSSPVVITESCHRTGSVSWTAARGRAKTGSMTTIKIGNHLIGPGHRPYVIAEMSGNHNGSLDRALQLVDAAAESGAHALKLQTYTPDTITIDADGPDFRLSAGHELWGGQTLYELYQQAHTPYEWHEP